MKANELAPGLVSSGAMYRLKTVVPVEAGDIVHINGPWDKFGVVLSVNEETGYHSIRGIGSSKELAKALLGLHVPYCIGE